MSVLVRRGLDGRARRADYGRHRSYQPEAQCGLRDNSLRLGARCSRSLLRGCAPAPMTMRSIGSKLEDARWREAAETLGLELWNVRGKKVRVQKGGVARSRSKRN